MKKFIVEGTSKKKIKLLGDNLPLTAIALSFVDFPCFFLLLNIHNMP